MVFPSIQHLEITLLERVFCTNTTDCSYYSSLVRELKEGNHLGAPE